MASAYPASWSLSLAVWKDSTLPCCWPSADLRPCACGKRALPLSTDAVWAWSALELEIVLSFYSSFAFSAKAVGSSALLGGTYPKRKLLT